MLGSKLLDAAAKPFNYAAALFLLFMMLYTVWSVAERYILGSTFVGDTELMVLAMGFCVFLGIPAVTLRDQHVAVDLIDHLVSKDVRKVLHWVGLAATFVFITLAVAYSVEPALEKLEFGETSMSLALNRFWFRLPILIGLAFTALACILVAAVWFRQGPPDTPAPTSD